MKSNTNFFFKLFNNEFQKLLQKIRSFSPIDYQLAFIRGWYLHRPKMVILKYNIKGWPFIRAWVFIRYFTVSNLHNHEY